MTTKNTADSESSLYCFVMNISNREAKFQNISVTMVSTVQFKGTLKRFWQLHVLQTWSTLFHIFHCPSIFSISFSLCSLGLQELPGLSWGFFLFISCVEKQKCVTFFSLLQGLQAESVEEDNIKPLLSEYGDVLDLLKNLPDAVHTSPSLHPHRHHQSPPTTTTSPSLQHHHHQFPPSTSNQYRPSTPPVHTSPSSHNHHNLHYHHHQSPSPVTTNTSASHPPASAPSSSTSVVSQTIPRPRSSTVIGLPVNSLVGTTLFGPRSSVNGQAVGQSAVQHLSGSRSSIGGQSVTQLSSQVFSGERNSVMGHVVGLPLSGSRTSLQSHPATSQDTSGSRSSVGCQPASQPLSDSRSSLLNHPLPSQAISQALSGSKSSLLGHQSVLSHRGGGSQAVHKRKQSLTSPPVGSPIPSSTTHSHSLPRPKHKSTAPVEYSTVCWWSIFYGLFSFYENVILYIRPFRHLTFHAHIYTRTFYPDPVKSPASVRSSYCLLMEYFAHFYHRLIIAGIRILKALLVAELTEIKWTSSLLQYFYFEVYWVSFRRRLGFSLPPAHHTLIMTHTVASE